MAIYTNSLVSDGPFLFISGQTPEENGNTPEDVKAQTLVTLQKICTTVTAHQLKLSNIVKINVYITDASYLADVRSAFTEVFGEIKPTMTLVVVSGLIDKRFKIEIDAIVNFSKAE